MRFLIGFTTGMGLGFAIIAIATGDSGPAAMAQVRTRRAGGAWRGDTPG
jgi:hypothetical protein